MGDLSQNDDAYGGGGVWDLNDDNGNIFSKNKTAAAMIYHPLFAKLSPSPSSNWAVAGSIPIFQPAGKPAVRPTLRNSTFQA